MNPRISEHPWSEESLFNKAKLYAQKMEDHDIEDFQFGVLSALSLELLARAALAHISPVLLAENRDWKNLVHTLDRSTTFTKFIPRSVSTSVIFSRLKELVPSFNKEVLGICAEHTERRNSELHSGELAFTNLETSVWLPKFYFACHEILKSMDKEIEDFFSQPEKVRKMVNEHREKAGKTVMKDINSHKTVWEKKSDKNRKIAKTRARFWSRRQKGHRVNCPSCNSAALIQGSPFGEVKTEIIEDEVTQRQSQFPSSFECIACGLKITGLSKLSACGLGGAYIGKWTSPVAEYFNLYTEEDLEEVRNEWGVYEPDFNE